MHLILIGLLLTTSSLGEEQAGIRITTSEADTTGGNRSEEIENKSLFSVTSRASQGCRSYQGGAGRCIPYSECGESFENEFIARNSLCGFSNRRPLVCCPHNTFGFAPSFQPFFPGFQQNFFQQNPFANSFFYNPAQSFYQQPSYSRGFFDSPYGGNNGYGFNNFNSNPYGNSFIRPHPPPFYLDPPALFALNNYHRYPGYRPSQYERPVYQQQPAYIGQLPRPGNAPNQFGLPAFQQNNNNNNDQHSNQPLPSDSMLNSRYCGLTNATTKRIVGGREAAVGAWPWLALIFVDVSGNGYKAPLCGGTLINQDHILTAAHCVNLMGNVLAASRFTVRLGEHDYLATDDGANPVDIDVNRVFSHPNFNNRTYFNDIAVMRLSRSVPFGHGVGPICLPDTSGDDSEYKGRSASVAGWGELYYAGPASSILQETTLPIQSLETCKEAFKRTVIKFNEKYLCAGSLQGDRDTCRGDSGGPLMLLNENGRYSVIGVTSFGRRCAEKGYPGSYTRVAKYTDWINRVVTSS